MKEGNSEGVLPCLILNKHHVDMDMKCTASIEHWQIVSRSFVYYVGQEYSVPFEQYSILNTQYAPKIFALLTVKALLSPRGM